MLSRIDGAFLALDTEHGIYREHRQLRVETGPSALLLDLTPKKESLPLARGDPPPRRLVVKIRHLNADQP
jgi:hypothetical protein